MMTKRDLLLTCDQQNDAEIGQQTMRLTVGRLSILCDRHSRQLLTTDKKIHKS
jgi:hypothetical protein